MRESGGNPEGLPPWDGPASSRQGRSEQTAPGRLHGKQTNTGDARAHGKSPRAVRQASLSLSPAPHTFARQPPASLRAQGQLASLSTPHSHPLRHRVLDRGQGSMGAELVTQGHTHLHSRNRSPFSHTFSFPTPPPGPQLHSPRSCPRDSRTWVEDTSRG